MQDVHYHVPREKAIPSGTQDFQRDGVSIPHPSLVADPQPYPSLALRLEWATRMSVLHELDAGSATTLKHLAFRAGSHRGCFQSRETISLETRVSVRTLNKTLKLLEKRSLIISRKQFSSTTTYCLPIPAIFAEMENPSKTAESAESPVISANFDD